VGQSWVVHERRRRGRHCYGNLVERTALVPLFWDLFCWLVGVDLVQVVVMGVVATGTTWKELQLLPLFGSCFVGLREWVPCFMTSGVVLGVFA
jgi:hypothetical protein